MSSTRDAFFYLAFAGFVSFLVWVVIVSILMFMQGSEASEIDTAVIVERTSA